MLKITNNHNRVSNVEYVFKSNTAILSVRRIEWSDAYDTMEVKFGMGKYDSSALRIHNDLRKRITSSVSVSSSETVSFPSAPSATPTSDTSVHDIGYSVPAGFNLGSFATSYVYTLTLVYQLNVTNVYD